MFNPVNDKMLSTKVNFSFIFLIQGRFFLLCINNLLCVMLLIHFKNNLGFS